LIGISEGKQSLDAVPSPPVRKRRTAIAGKER